MNNVLNEIDKCVQCGFCLPTCPTYLITQNEKSSPRGRIQLLKFYENKNLDFSKEIVRELFFCLGCFACESACPSGVKYETILNHYRQKSFSQKKFSLKIFFLNFVLLNEIRKKFFFKFIFLFQELFSRTEKHSIKFLELLQLFPKVSNGKNFFSTHQQYENENIVGFPIGCVNDICFTEVNLTTINLLQKNNYGVCVSQNNCCGALHFHNGDIKNAKKLAKKNVEYFDGKKYKYIVSTNAGCGAFMKQYGEVFNETKFESFSEKVRDISEVLVKFDFSKLKPKFKNLRISYQDACHLRHSQKIFLEPRKILKSLPNIDFVELNDPNICCGSAGIYNATNFDDSMKLLELKIENIKNTSAEIIISENSGCINQLRYGIKKNNSQTEILHISEFLDKYFEYE